MGYSHTGCGLAIQCGRTRPVILPNVHRSANKLVATLHKKRRRHPCTVFFSDQRPTMSKLGLSLMVAVALTAVLLVAAAQMPYSDATARIEVAVRLMQ